MLALLGHTPIPEPQASYASSWIRERQGLRLAAQHDEILRTVQPPPVDEQATRLLQYFAARYPQPGARFDASFIDPAVMAVAWATNPLHLTFLIWDYLCSTKTFLTPDNTVAVQNAYKVHISPKGWEYLQSLRIRNPQSELGFIAMWFHESTTQLRDEGLRPAVAKAGYRPIVMDELRHANRIDSEIVATIRQSRVLVADIRGRRGGVYYEAGLAQGLGIPVFWTCQQRVLDRQRLHFDIRQYPFTPWTTNNWPDFVLQLSSLIVAVAGPGPLIRP